VRTITLAILFADVCQSTKLYETLGDVRAHSVILHTLEQLETQVAKFRGKVIKKIGDEIMCAFKEPADAILAACAMQQVIKGDVMLRQVNLAIRIGMHYGEVLLDHNDIFGDAVNVSSRAAGLAGAEEIIATAETVLPAQAQLFTNVRHMARIHVEGKAEKIDFFEILWQEDQMDVTYRVDSDFLSQTLETQTLVLNYRGKQVQVDNQHPLLLLGRGPQNDVVVAELDVSRDHAMIKYRNNKFAFIDKSTNGSYLSLHSGEEIFLHREEMQLLGKGRISLGKEFATAGDSVIAYEIHS